MVSILRADPMLTQYMLHRMTQCIFFFLIKLSRIKHSGSQRFLPVIVWYFQEDSEQELDCFSVCRCDHHIGPRSQSKALCEVALGFSRYALASISELGKKGGGQSLPEVLELEET